MTSITSDDLPCDICTSWRGADVAVVLDNGEEWYACVEHVADLIRREATTENPVHAIEPIEQGPVGEHLGC